MMARRRYTERFGCASPGCREFALYEYDTMRERDESVRWNREHPYRCLRHSHEGEVLSAESPARECTLTVVTGGWPSRWEAPGVVSRSMVNGPGFRAFAKDFPVGTRLVVTARLETPDLPHASAAVPEGAIAGD